MEEDSIVGSSGGYFHPTRHVGDLLHQYIPEVSRMLVYKRGDYADFVVELVLWYVFVFVYLYYTFARYVVGCPS